MTGGEVETAYPARTYFRGFSRDSEDEGFKKLTEHLAENSNALLEEVSRED